MRAFTDLWGYALKYFDNLKTLIQEHSDMLNRNLLLLFMALFVASCGIVGIHPQVHNPKRDKPYPLFSEEYKKLGMLNDLRTCYDVSFYFLDIAIDSKEKTLSGWVEIRGKALQPISKLQIDLHADLTIDELRYGNRAGAALNFKRDLRAVEIDLPKSLLTNDTFSIHVHYQGTPVIANRPPWVGGAVWKRDKKKNDWLGITCEMEGASIWFPCKDLNNDEPDSAVMRFTIPQQNLTAVSNGVLEKEEYSDGKHTFTWRVHNPINLYNITYYVGDFVSIKDQYTGITGKNLDITHYVLRDNEQKAREHFKAVKKHILAYEKAWGPYMFYEDGFKLIESPYAGMEHQSAIAYGNGYRNDLFGKEDYIMLHETGHEWFGNAITASDLADVWLQEGITTFGETVYLENAYNKQVALRLLLGYRMTIKNQHPLVGPLQVRYFDYKDSDVYTKGAWMLHTLRDQLQDDTLFFTIMRTFYQQYALKTTSSRDFIQTVNDITGNDYNWFFNQYLYRRTAPVLEYQLTDDALYYRWIDCDTSFNKMFIRVKTEKFNEVITLIPSTEIKRFTLPGGMGKKLSVYNLYAFFGRQSNDKLEKIYKAKKD
jgi:aminopeptidase N